LLVLLLVAASVIATFEYAQNAQLLAENERLKKELSDSSQRLLAMQTQLNETQGEVAKLHIDIAKLDEEISKLREQLRIAGSITVGLTFLWATENYVWKGWNISDLQAVVQHMNDVQWAGTGIYFFIRHAGSIDFMGGGEKCQDICGGISWCYMATGGGPRFQYWATKAWELYPEGDIPVGVFGSVGIDETGAPLQGCAWESKKPYMIVVAADFNMKERRVTLNTTEGTVLTSEWQIDIESSAMLLTHELLHVFGFSDQELKAENVYSPYSALPTAWIPRIQAAAKAFESKPPQPGSG
jgi:hypothetical protein